MTEPMLIAAILFVAVTFIEAWAISRAHERIDMSDVEHNNNEKAIGQRIDDLGDHMDMLQTMVDDCLFLADGAPKEAKTVPEGHKLCLYRVTVKYSWIRFVNGIETTESNREYVQHFDDPPTAGDIIAILRNHIGDINHVNSITVDTVNLAEF